MLNNDTIRGRCARVILTMLTGDLDNAMGWSRAEHNLFLLAWEGRGDG